MREKRLGKLRPDPPAEVCADAADQQREDCTEAVEVEADADAQRRQPVGVPDEGEAHLIEWQADWPRAICRSEGTIRLGGPEAMIEARVLRWLKAEARRVYTDEIAHYCEQAGEPVPRLSLGDPRSRWGSCSSRGTISLSWRLIMAPAHVRRSVIAHEVAHIRHMDHSRDFYSWLDQLYEGDRKAADRWLKMHGTGLQRVGR